MKAVLALEGVRSGYGSIEVLHGIDLVVPSGAAVALLGANGAGKSTLLKVIAGLLPTTDGRILFDGSPAAGEPAWRRSRAGMCLIPEGRGIFRHLTVEQNLAVFAGGRDVAGAVERAVTHFPVLGTRLAQPARTLSGGQQQMLAVSRALLSPARLVLADELSLGLAPVVIDDILVAIDSLRAAGRSLLVVEQYVQRALGIADWVYILHKGRVVFVGESQQCRDGMVLEHFFGKTA